MAHLVGLGVGLGGAIMAHELEDQLWPETTVTVVTKGPEVKVLGIDKLNETTKG